MEELERLHVEPRCDVERTRMLLSLVRRLKGLDTGPEAVDLHEEAAAIEAAVRYLRPE